MAKTNSKARLNSDDLTPAQARVLKVLTASSKPMSAYDILAATAMTELRTPVQVYRVLKRLIATGHIHRIETLSAFVACDRGQHETQAVFTICEACGVVAELEPSEAGLGNVTPRSGFQVKRVIAEVLGLCAACATRASPVGSHTHT
jgi:Fur family transcriptional regulator, zinc uptake regulator